MSLINDALKRANETKPPGTPTALEMAAAPLKPVEYSPRAAETGGPPSWLIFLFPIVLLLVCGVAGGLIYQGWRGSDGANGQSGINVAARENSKTDAPTPAPPTDIASAVFAAFTNHTTTNASSQPTVPTFPELKLQGVFYRKSNPSAVINSKTVYRGDKIDSARVMDIRQHSVTVQWNGQTRVLNMD